MRPESRTDVGGIRLEPAVKITAAVSPMLRPMLSMMPVTIPGSALGSTTRVTVCQRVPPSE